MQKWTWFELHVGLVEIFLHAMRTFKYSAPLNRKHLPTPMLATELLDGLEGFSCLSTSTGKGHLKCRVGSRKEHAAHAH